VQADHFFVVYYALDDEDKEAGISADDDFDERKWIKANPLMEVNPLLLKEIRKEALEAKSMPGRHAEFKIKRLNRPSAVAGGWTNIVKWRACTGTVDLEQLKSVPCWGGLDLAATRDLTSFRIAWRVDDRWYTHGWRFVPRAAIKARSERALVPYAAWLLSGHLISAGDEVVDYDIVRQYIVEAQRKFNLQRVGYDSWNAQQLVPKLTDAGVTMEEVIQGAKSYHPAMKELERAYIAGNLAHGNDPVLNWCAGNLVARTDANMNTAPDKRRAPDKIDDIVALLMAIAMGIKEREKEVKPQLFFL
jgi:phage terminase large subunit-like protein